MSSVKTRPAVIASSRAARAAKWTLRVARNVFAVLGVLFVYLLVMGAMQYQDRIAAGDTSCTLTHCV
jgi:hypothetical protein